MIEVAPAVGTLGLPEAVALSASASQSAQVAVGRASEAELLPRTMDEVVQALRAYFGQGELLKLHEVQPLVDRGLELAGDTSLSKLADLSDCFRELRLRVPLRGIMPAVTECLDRRDAAAEPDALKSAVRIMSNMGKGSIFCAEVFEFCHMHSASMGASIMATYIYEAGRHGLRCRHFLDAIVARAADKVPEMSLEEAMMAAQGAVRFSRDWTELFQALRPVMLSNLRGMDPKQLLLAYRAGRDLRHIPEFATLHTACAGELSSRVESLTLAETASCLLLTTYSPKFRAQAHSLVRTIDQKWTKTEDLTPLRVVEIVDALETFASWSMKPLPLADRLDKLLVDRTVELKYAGNASLWVMATQAFARMEHLDASWPRVALELAQDKAFVERASFYQQGFVVQAFSKLRLFDSVVYDNIADLMISDRALFKEPKDLAQVLSAYVLVGSFQQQLFDGAYDIVLEWLEREELNLTQVATQQSIIQIAWCFAVAGYHKRYESFAAILDHAFFTERSRLRPITVRRLAQLADVVLQEAPARADGMHDRDRITSTRTDPAVRRIISSEPASDPRLFQELRTALRALEWPCEVFAVPDDSSAFLVDISLEAHVGKKVGLLVAGRFDDVRVGLSKEQLQPAAGGQLSLARRMLLSRGWRIAVISGADWATADTLEKQKAFLEKAVSKAAADEVTV